MLELDGVEVVGVADPNWERHLQKFIRLFIGETPNAAFVQIQNPEVLSFEDRIGRFTAVASAPLIIRNGALGYEIQYFLEAFTATPTRVSYDGEGLYEEMDPPTPEVGQQWEGLRRQAWYGSWRHFILSVMDGEHEQAGFHIFSRPGMRDVTVNPSMASGGGGVLGGRQRFPIDPADMLGEGETALEHELTFHGFVEIVFTGETEPDHYRAWRNEGEALRDRPQTSWISLERGPTIVDYKGDVLDPGFPGHEHVGVFDALVAVTGAVGNFVHHRTEPLFGPAGAVAQLAEIRCLQVDQELWASSAGGAPAAQKLIGHLLGLAGDHPQGRFPKIGEPRYRITTLEFACRLIPQCPDTERTDKGETIQGGGLEESDLIEFGILHSPAPVIGQTVGKYTMKIV